MFISLLFTLQFTRSTTLSSSLHIDSTDTNALLDNGVYTCHVRVTIAGVDSYVYSSGQSTVSLRGYICVLCSMCACVSIWHNLCTYCTLFYAACLCVCCCCLQCTVTILYILVCSCYCAVHNKFRAVNITSTSIVFRWDAPAFGMVSQYNVTCTDEEHSFTVSIVSIKPLVLLIKVLRIVMISTRSCELDCELLH